MLCFKWIHFERLSKNSDAKNKTLERCYFLQGLFLWPHILHSGVYLRKRAPPRYQDAWGWCWGEFGVFPGVPGWVLRSKIVILRSKSGKRCFTACKRCFTGYFTTLHFRPILALRTPGITQKSTQHHPKNGPWSPEVPNVSKM